MPITIKSEVLTVRFPLTDDGSQFLRIKYLPHNTLHDLRAKATDRILDRRTHQYTEQVDPKKWSKIFIAAALDGWEGVTWKTYKELLEPVVAIENENMDAPLPDTQEVREVLCNYGKQDILLAIIKTATDEFELAVERERETVRGNS